MGQFPTNDSIISRGMPLTATMIASIDPRPAWVHENQTGTLGTFLNSSILYVGAAGDVSVILPGMSLNSVATLTLSAGGSGYTTATGAATTCSNANASGLTVDTTAVAGAITVIAINAAGSGYNPGDIITVAGGGGDGTAVIDTVNVDAPIAAQALTFKAVPAGTILPVAVDYVTALNTVTVADIIVGK